jgi:hypothetical protein
VACSVLSGVKAEGLPIDNGHSLVAAVQAELPRFLRFVARRADERQPGAPDVAAAALDLAASLEFGTAERGGGVLLEVIKRAYQPDESRRRKVLADYRSSYPVEPTRWTLLCLTLRRERGKLPNNAPGST